MLLNDDQDIAPLIAKLADLERSHRVSLTSPVVGDLSDESLAVATRMLVGFTAVDMHDSDVVTLEELAYRPRRERLPSACVPSDAVRVRPGLLASDLRNLETCPLAKHGYCIVADTSMRAFCHDFKYSLWSPNANERPDRAAVWVSVPRPNSGMVGHSAPTVGRSGRLRLRPAERRQPARQDRQPHETM